uniref:Retrotransposon gag domain-containing protein n=1 Tax=Amphimedon queenslandica TaxID=400682 RepID=A0A1X7V0S5_AMPQE
CWNPRSKKITWSYQVTALQPFNSATPGEWEKWFRRFERLRGASGLFEKEEVQVSNLIYTMGAEADEIFRSFKLTTAQAKKYDTVIEKFTSDFIKKRNIIYEEAKCNEMQGGRIGRCFCH